MEVAGGGGEEAKGGNGGKAGSQAEMGSTDDAEQPNEERVFFP